MTRFKLTIFLLLITNVFLFAQKISIDTKPNTIKMANQINHNAKTFSLNPYRWILKTRIVKGFNELNKQNYHYLTNLFDENVQYEFEGDHTLGGSRTSKIGVEKWFERLLLLLPSQFSINSITVSGPVWETTAIIEFTDTVTPKFGQPYKNNGIQVVKLKFGKAYKIHTYVNTYKIITALNILYENGIIEAKADSCD